MKGRCKKGGKRWRRGMPPGKTKRMVVKGILKQKWLVGQGDFLFHLIGGVGIHSILIEG